MGGNGILPAVFGFGGLMCGAGLAVGLIMSGETWWWATAPLVGVVVGSAVGRMLE
jgi:hypothetical protein